MNQPIHLIGEIYCFGPLPEGSKDFDFEIDTDEDWYYLTYMLMIDDEDSGFYGEDEQHSIQFPVGNWQIICTTKEVTRSQAAELVQWFEIDSQRGYRDYAHPDDLRYPFRDPISSWRSLLRAMGVDLNKNYILIKKS